MEFQQVIKSRMAEWCQAMTNNNATSRAIVLCQQNGVEISFFLQFNRGIQNFYEKVLQNLLSNDLPIDDWELILWC